MLKLILTALAIFLAVRLLQQKIEEKKQSIKQREENGRIIEGEVVNDEDESNNGDKS